MTFCLRGQEKRGNKERRSIAGSVIAEARGGGQGGFLPVIMRQKSLNLALQELSLSLAPTKVRGTGL